MELSPISFEIHSRINNAASLIRSAKYLTAFTGAGVSVESGIPPFRGPSGLWGKYDPRMLELDYFLARPDTAWPVIKEIFYENFGRAKPNKAHEVLAEWEARGLLKTLITQNGDNLHLEAACRNWSATRFARWQNFPLPRPAHLFRDNVSGSLPRDAADITLAAALAPEAP